MKKVVCIAAKIKKALAAGTGRKTFLQESMIFQKDLSGLIRF